MASLRFVYARRSRSQVGAGAWCVWGRGRLLSGYFVITPSGGASLPVALDSLTQHGQVPASPRGHHFRSIAPVVAKFADAT